MGLYDFNSDFFVNDAIPPIKRSGDVFNAYVKALMKPLQEKHDDIMNNYFPDVLQRLNYNSQTIIFEAVLNKLLGITSDPKVFFTNTADSLTPIYFPKEGEAIGVFFSTETEDLPIYFGTEAEYDPEFDFVVHVPSAFVSQNLQIITEIKKYKVAGRTFSIIYY